LAASSWSNRSGPLSRRFSRADSLMLAAAEENRFESNNCCEVIFVVYARSLQLKAHFERPLLSCFKNRREMGQQTI
jgi:hypothetical protein